MDKASRGFQVFAKPAGPICNLRCHYCYYLEKERLYPMGESFRMPDDILEAYIIQHIDASPDEVIRFSWHGGEPTVLGLDYFRRIVALQRKHQPAHRQIANGIQTNGTLLDEDWCRFLASEGFAVGLSLDGPRQLHDLCRVTKDRKPSYQQTMRGYELLRQYQVSTDILCVVNAHNAKHPTEVYRFFKGIGAPYLTFLPLVEPQTDVEGGVSALTVRANAWGDFLCTIFDEWVDGDIGRIKVQIFEEAARTAFGQEHSLCIFRPVCGDIPVVEHNGDCYSCDHFVDAEHRLGNIREAPLVELIESAAQRAFGHAKRGTLPRTCRFCQVREMCNGECPKNRFLTSPDGEAGLNYLCEGYKRFFTHCLPFVEEVAAEWRRETLEQRTKQAHAAAAHSTSTPG
ncbi:MAG: anaerobic sulfatase maturase, partial [Proteobacteria bacterium]|nr:anaerobic sulfatase maturase [Pseudomonadota bacterium]